MAVLNVAFWRYDLALRWHGAKHTRIHWRIERSESGAVGLIVAVRRLSFSAWRWGR